MCYPNTDTCSHAMTRTTLRMAPPRGYSGAKLMEASADKEKRCIKLYKAIWHGAGRPLLEEIPGVRKGFKAEWSLMTSCW